MSNTDFVVAVVSHTPLWVWGMLAALLALGFSQTVERRVPRIRVAALPLVLLAIGIANLAAGFVAQPSSLAAWLASLLAFGALGARLPVAAGTRWLPEQQRLQLPGSWLPLALIVAVFSLRYGAAVTLALHPQWRDAAALPLALLYGAISGLLGGRAVGLLRLTRAPRPAATPAPDATISGHGSVGIL